MRSVDEPSGPPRHAHADKRLSTDGAAWMRRAVIALAALGVLTSGCGTATFSSEDLRVETTGNTVYLMARSAEVSRSLCVGLGGDVAQAEAKSATAGGRTIQLARSRGCYTVRNVIVCSDGDAACLAHEERHRREGAFHK